MAYYKRTRVVSQDMRTGEFAYLDQLVKDGYNPGLLVLPKNWEPPLRQGPSSFLPIEPIINLSPPNTTDDLPIVLQNLINIDTGAAVFQMFSNTYLGRISTIVEQNTSGASCISACGTVIVDITKSITGQVSVSTAATTTYPEVTPIVTGISSVSTANASGIMVNIEGTTTVSVTGIQVTSTTGTVLNGSGWGQGGGWGSNGWGVA